MLFTQLWIPISCARIALKRTVLAAAATITGIIQPVRSVATPYIWTAARVFRPLGAPVNRKNDTRDA
ncbi:MAG: hypothetical protein RE469_02965 [Cuniculiplasma divulgatum]|jgi:hypothetical protein|nr:MAG: hypothetical protein RE469_02965 [Cuniculiplasma divulgatum]